MARQEIEKLRAIWRERGGMPETQKSWPPPPAGEPPQIPTLTQEPRNARTDIPRSLANLASAILICEIPFLIGFIIADHLHDGSAASIGLYITGWIHYARSTSSMMFALSAIGLSLIALLMGERRRSIAPLVIAALQLAAILL
jgi:hypothetical protein